MTLLPLIAVISSLFIVILAIILLVGAIIILVKQSKQSNTAEGDGNGTTDIEGFAVDTASDPTAEETTPTAEAECNTAENSVPAAEETAATDTHAETAAPIVQINNVNQNG